MSKEGSLQRDRTAIGDRDAALDDGGNYHFRARRRRRSQNSSQILINARSAVRSSHTNVRQREGARRLRHPLSNYTLARLIHISVKIVG